MNGCEVLMVRIHLTEHRARPEALLERLRRAGLQGATVYRAIAGFGPSGETHSARLTDLALDLPLTVEFYDRPERVEAVLAQLRHDIDPRHIVCWRATVLAPEGTNET